MDSPLLVAGIIRGLYCLVLFLTALFLILLVLIQRGRGGGLAGAFGGMGGQSAFGTKAGDTFTKITIVVATLWIILCIVGVKFGGQEDSIMTKASGPAITAPTTEEPTDGALLDDLESAASDQAVEESSPDVTDEATTAEAATADVTNEAETASGAATATGEGSAIEVPAKEDAPAGDAPAHGSSMGLRARTSSRLVHA